MEQRIMAELEQRNKIKNNAKRMIWVKFCKEGIHRYPDAEHHPLLESVKFLAYPHRHIFHFRVAIQVFHSDRDIEFILFKRWLESLFEANGVLDLNYKSCEMLADDLYEVIASKYPGRFIEISVSEDNENGATISYNNFVD